MLGLESQKESGTNTGCRCDKRNNHNYGTPTVTASVCANITHILSDNRTALQRKHYLPFKRGQLRPKEANDSQELTKLARERVEPGTQLLPPRP